MLTNLEKIGKSVLPSFLAPKYSGLNKHFVRLPELGVVIKPSVGGSPLFLKTPH